LLRPAEVDEANGYRYYTPDLADRARLVVQMREAGMPIEDMRAVLDGTPADRRRVLREFVDEQEARSARTTALLAQVSSTIEEPAQHTPAARLVVRGPELASALRQVRPAADHDATSPLGATLLEVTGGTLDVVATNRYWMAVRTLPLDTPADDVRVVLSLATASRLAEKLDTFEDVAVEIGDNVVKAAGHEFHGRDTAYPAHRLVVAGLEPVLVRAVLRRDDLTDALELVGRSEVTLVLGGAGALVTDEESGFAHKADGVVTGPGMTLRLGTALMQRALASALGPEIELGLSAPDRAVQVRSPYQRGFLTLVMPLGVS
jgi:DNA-binding transcriptional MerR regulator